MGSEPYSRLKQRGGPTFEVSIVCITKPAIVQTSVQLRNLHPVVCVNSLTISSSLLDNGNLQCLGYVFYIIKLGLPLLLLGSIRWDWLERLNWYTVNLEIFVVKIIFS